MFSTTLILASNSPRRRELLTLGGWSFKVQPCEVDERVLPGEAPGEYVLRLAKAKALGCAQQEQNLPVLAADTSVADGQELLGKPGSAHEAVETLRKLRGHAHKVCSGIAVLRMPGRQLVTDLCVSEVIMRDYSDDEVEAYVTSGDPLDKAGGYAIQHSRFHPVASISGCYASVMGLPLCHVSRCLKRLGFATQEDLAEKCKSGLGYDCPVSVAILNGEDPG